MFFNNSIYLIILYIRIHYLYRKEVKTENTSFYVISTKEPYLYVIILYNDIFMSFLSKDIPFPRYMHYWKLIIAISFNFVCTFFTQYPVDFVFKIFIIFIIFLPDLSNSFAAILQFIITFCNYNLIICV